MNKKKLKRKIRKLENDLIYWTMLEEKVERHRDRLLDGILDLIREAVRDPS